MPRRADLVARWPRDDAGYVECAVCAGHVRGQLELVLPSPRFRINSCSSGSPRIRGYTQARVTATWYARELCA